MRLPKTVDLFYLPTQTTAEAKIVRLTDRLIAERLAEPWWSDPQLDADLIEDEIDRHWDWSEFQIERAGETR